MSTSMPTKLPEASVYSKGLNTVSVAMTQVLSEPAVSAEAASEEALSAAEELVDGVEPQAASDSAITAAMPKAKSFFMVCSFPLYTDSAARGRGGCTGIYRKKGNSNPYGCYHP